jgi:membrane-bound ClpP family serine protease
MSLGLWAILLFAVALILLVAELVVPSHGALGFLALLAAAGGVVLCYRINLLLGSGVFIGGLIASPFVWAAFIKLWPRTPVGRRMILPRAEPSAPPTESIIVRIGDVGRTVSELRPIGICDFGGERVESVSEHGIIDEGSAVRVVAVHNRRPTVRAVGTA